LHPFRLAGRLPFNREGMSRLRIGNLLSGARLRRAEFPCAQKSQYRDLITQVALSPRWSHRGGGSNVTPLSIFHILALLDIATKRPVQHKPFLPASFHLQQSFLGCCSTSLRPQPAGTFERWRLDAKGSFSRNGDISGGRESRSTI
jgi:hypothetical protein